MAMGPTGELGQETVMPLAVALPLTCWSRKPVSVEPSCSVKAEPAPALLKATM